MSLSAPEVINTIDLGMRGCTLGFIMVNTEERGTSSDSVTLLWLCCEKEADQGPQREFSIWLVVILMHN